MKIGQIHSSVCHLRIITVLFSILPFFLTLYENEVTIISVFACENCCVLSDCHLTDGDDSGYMFPMVYLHQHHAKWLDLGLIIPIQIVAKTWQ